MGVLRVVSAVLGAGSTGLSVADRVSGSIEKPDEAVDPIADSVFEAGRPFDDLAPTYPSQRESAALLDAALDRARENARHAAS